MTPESIVALLLAMIILAVAPGSGVFDAVRSEI
jgi:hypothetical protein